MKQLSLAAWRGYANLILDRTKYVGTWKASANKAKIRMEIRNRGEMGDHGHLWKAHETDVPLRDAFPIGFGDC